MPPYLTTPAADEFARRIADGGLIPSPWAARRELRRAAWEAERAGDHLNARRLHHRRGALSATVNAWIAG